MTTLAETIKNLIKTHITKNGGYLLAQNLSGVGAIQNTVPTNLSFLPNYIDLPTSDVSNGGVVTGLGLAGVRPIYCIRYQGFSWYNMITPLNYAAKSKELWGVPCPIFIRALAMEGAIGPVASGANHSIVAHMPGIKVVAPCTPSEYRKAWNDFIEGDDPVYCSEHRKTLGWTDNTICQLIRNNSLVNIFLIGGARLELSALYNQTLSYPPGASIISLVNLKPLDKSIFKHITNRTKLNVIVDSDYTICGMSEHIAYELMIRTGVKSIAIGLEDRTAGFSETTDNVTPNATKILNIINKELQL